MARKKYKKQYTTKDRLDMSKGGRVKYQKGKRVRDLSDPTGQTFLDPKDVPNMKVGNQEPRNNTPAPPVENRAAPTTFQQAPITPKEPPISIGGVRGITAQPEVKLKQVDSSGNILKDTLIGRQPGETAEQYRARTAGQFTPNPNQKTSKGFRENLAVKDTKDYASMSDDEIKKLIPQISYGTPGNERTVPISQERIDEFRLEKTNPGLLFEMVQKGADISPNDYNDPTAKKVAERLLNQRLAMKKAAQDAASNKPTPKPAPDGTPENPFQMQPVQTTQAAQAQGPGGLWWRDAGYDSPREAINDGWTYDSNSRTWIPGGTDTDTGTGTGAGTGTNTDTDTNTDTETETELTPEELAAQEKARQQQVARQSAEAAARGEVPEAAQIPQAEQVGYERDAQGQLLLDDQGNPIPLREQQVTTMDPVTRARTDIRAEGQAPEQVTTVGEAATAKTPEQIRTETITDDDLTLVPEEAQVDFATGEVSDKAIAEAAQVDRVAPIEGAEVEIPEGALAERVVGKISEGAKATAVMNVGTSLSRITRAKKQLSRAGLSNADIEEIGNDPEALEARLADFSEEQRGIIEGLPQEALVSTQMNNLLEGIESGEIPTWARPAVAQVEQMLARRGMSASTVGRDSLFNAIIQSAMPIAQSNAQAIQQSVSQQKTIEAQTAEANAQRMQQTALTNAQNVFNMDMAQFSADQQTVLSNSKFMQTVALTEASNEQQATIQNAVLMSQANLAEADFYQKAQIQNAQAFLQMDVQNLANEQQSNILKAQQTQQRMLSNQSAQNAAAQFNAASENQTQQFMASLNAQIDQYNTSQMNAMSQFDATQKNTAAARDANRAADVEKFNTQLETQIDQFNANQDFARNQWNAQNKAVVEQSNTQWRRNTNTANTAMQNQINAQNAQNAFAMSQTAQSFLWQELRDQADYDFRNGENEKNRIAQLVNTALASDPSKYGGSVSSIEKLIGAIIGDIT